MYNMQAVEGELVKVHYVGTLEDGSVFEDSRQRGEPLQFIVGHGSILPAFNKTVIGMRAGETRSVTIEPEEAYGPVNPDLLRVIEKNALGDQEIPDIGSVVMFSIDDKQYPAQIRAIEEEEIMVDFNHPLAGQKISFEIELITRVTEGEESGKSNQDDKETGQD